MKSSPPSVTEFTMSTPQSPFARVGSFPVAIPGLACHRFHDAVLVGTAQMYGHGLPSKRDAVLAHGGVVRVTAFA